jgi:hypothetical protein
MGRPDQPQDLPRGASRTGGVQLVMAMAVFPGCYKLLRNDESSFPAPRKTASKWWTRPAMTPG